MIEGVEHVVVEGLFLCVHCTTIEKESMFYLLAR